MQTKVKPGEFLNCKRSFWNDRIKSSEWGHGRNASWRGRQRRDLDFHQVFSVLQSPAKLHGSCLLALETRGIGFLSAYLLPIISPGSQIQMFAAPPAALMSLQSYYMYFFVCLFLAPWVSLRKRCRCVFSILWRTRNDNGKALLTRLLAWRGVVLWT